MSHKYLFGVDLCLQELIFLSCVTRDSRVCELVPGCGELLSILLEEATGVELSMGLAPLTSQKLAFEEALYLAAIFRCWFPRNLGFLGFLFFLLFAIS